jgi:hypothetical protein
VTNYAYNKDIPQSNHNPSQDQPKMKENTNSILNLIGEDHYTFGVANGGFHKQMRIPALTNTAALAARISNSGTLWTQVNTSVGASTETNLHYIPGTGANDYQLTRCIASGFAQFSTNATYGAPPDASRDGGWTFLPGGMLLQYGTVTVNTDTVVPFPVVFSSVPFSVVVNGFYNSNSRSFTWVKTISTTGFTAAVRDSSGSNVLTTISWMAIGK